MTVEGVWDLTIATPVGRIKPVVELIRNGGEFTGVAHGAGEEVPLQRDLARSPGRSRPGGIAPSRTRRGAPQRRCGCPAAERPCVTSGGDRRHEAARSLDRVIDLERVVASRAAVYVR